MAKRFIFDVYHPMWIDPDAHGEELNEKMSMSRGKCWEELGKLIKLVKGLDIANIQDSTWFRIRSDKDITPELESKLIIGFSLDTDA